MSSTKSTLEDLNLSNDEAKRLGEAMKDENFRKMLIEYAEEISDPENRKRYEDEIAQMENERGMDISFVNPEPGYVIKTSVNGEAKVFINICKSDKIGKPASQRQESSSGQKGLQWSIPHSFSPCRNDMDNKGSACQVYDVVFHHDTYRMAETNKRFRKLVNDTAIDGIERQFDVKLDHANIKFPKLTFKGKPSPTVIRRKKENIESNTEFHQDMPYPYDSMTTEEKSAQKEAEILEREKTKNNDELKTTVKNINKFPVNNKPTNIQANIDDINNKGNTETPTEPKYSIIHRSAIDLQDFRDARDAKPSTRPNELVIHVELPLLSCSAAVSLDIFEKRLSLESVKPAAYKLDLDLPYPVDDNLGSAKFDKAKHRLTVTLPVLKAEVQKLPEYSDEEDDVSDADTDMVREPPLVEVISESQYPESDSLEASAIDNDREQLMNENDNCSSKDIWAEGNGDVTKILYNFPNYNHRQDNETVSIVLDVKNVSTDSLVKLFPLDNSVQVRFVSMGTGCFPKYYSFVAQFTQECPIAVEQTNVDVSPDNVVLVFPKLRKSRKHWDRFCIGLDPQHMEEVLFVTEKTLATQLNRLEEEAVENQKMIQDQSQSSENEVEVTDLSDKQLTIKIKKSRKKRNRKRGSGSSTTEDEEEDEIVDDGPLSSEIQVVCEHSTKLHGILKCRSRSFSESSDDVSSGYSRESSTTSQMSESPISETDELVHECGVKKTVSFNSHVDKTTFKSSATINAMHSALKTKRKNSRKRQEKREEKLNRKRNRHNSNDSQCSSSGDELGYLGRTRRDSGSCGNESDETSKKRVGKRDSSKNDCGAVDRAESATSGADCATAGILKRESEEFVDKNACASKIGNCSVDKNHVTVDEDALVNSKNVGDNEMGSKQNAGVENGSKCEQSDGKPTEDSNGSSIISRAKVSGGGENVDRVTGGRGDDDTKLDSDDENEPSTKAPPVIETKCDNRESATPKTPDTILSWEDKPPGFTQDQFRTKCAFEFTNGVIFDLDDD